MEVSTGRLACVLKYLDILSLTVAVGIPFKICSFQAKKNLKMKSSATILFMFFIFPCGLFSQELGLSFSKFRSDHNEIESPLGFAIYLSKAFLRSDVRLQTEYSYYRNEREYYGYLVSGFSPHPTTEKEKIRSISYMHSFEVSIRPAILKTKHILASLGFGVSYNIFDGKRESLATGRKSDLFAGNKFGTSVAVFFEKGKILNSPFNLFLTGKFMHFWPSVQPTDIAAPFGREINSTIIEIGISYSFKAGGK